MLSYHQDEDRIIDLSKSSCVTTLQTDLLTTSLPSKLQDTMLKMGFNIGFTNL